MGMMGQYISKIFMETKRRPMYIIKEAMSMENIELENTISKKKET